ncbi:glycoside hydrolase family 30 beta sandwich domain-containing protein [Kutzneria sp. NPDC051319]|uniref:glycoside hydrolase n=1 Tax=Kutzneria sp. NPDC051319 TaxID=3155047 RepID=UPI0034499AFE
MLRTTRRTRLLAAAIAGLATMFTLPATANAATAVSVNGATTYQRIDGFGVSESFNMANAIRGLSGSAQKQALDLLFSTSNGAGFSIVRNDIPSGSDSIEPRSPGSPSATPQYVWNPSNGGTEDGQLWLAQQAKNSYGVTNFYNNAWEPPSFMTNSAQRGGLCGVPGVSCSSGDWRQAYANYLVQDAKFWASAGITPSTLGFVNEPATGTGGFGSMLFTPAQAANFLSVLGPTLRSSGLSTKITCCDTLGFNQLPSYVSAVQGNSAANSAVGVFTSHGYSGAPTTPVSTGGRPVWESEWSINGNQWDGAWDDGNQADGFNWAQHVQTGLTDANLNAFFYFWGISTTSHDSSLIGLRGSTLTPAKRYYSLANYSRFIRPGATRIGATSGGGGLEVSAYKNPDGSVIVVALNSGTSSTSAAYTVANAGLTGGTVTPFLTNGSSNIAAQSSIPLSNGAFTATVPGRSLVTYRITP